MPFTFLMGGLLAGTLAMSIPVIIHLLHRQRTQPVLWGAMQFLHVSALQMKRRKKVENWLLMAVRILILGILAFLLARPLFVRGKYLPSALGGGSAPVDVAVVLDHSLSTGRQSNGRSVFEQSVNTLDEVARQLRDGDTLSVVLAEHQPRAFTTAPVRKSQADEIKQRLVAEKPGMTDCNIPGAVGFARQLAARGHNLNKMILVVSDEQRTNWHVNDDSAWRAAIGERIKGLEKNLSVHAYAIAPDAEAPNVSVGDIALQPSLIGLGRPVQITASVTNTGPKPMPAMNARLSVNGRATGESQPVPALAPQQSATLRFDHKFTAAGSNWVKVSVDANDSLAADNSSVAAANVWQKIPVLVIDGQLTSAGSFKGSQFLQTALRPEDQPLVQPTIVNISDALKAKLDDYMVAIVNDCPTLPSELLGRLHDYARSGHGLWMIFGPRTGRNLMSQELATAGLFSADVNELRTASPVPIGVEVRDATNPMISLIAANERNAFSGALTRQWWSIKPKDGDAQVILASANGEPLVLERPVPPNGGRVAVWCTSVDGSWNNWHLMPNFVPLVNETLYHLCSGQTKGLENRGIEAGQKIEWTGAAQPRVQAAQITRPDNTTVQLSSPRLYNGRQVLDYTDTHEPGIYQVRFAPTEVQSTYYAVGINRAELDPTPLKPEDNQWLAKAGYLDENHPRLTSPQELALIIRKENPGTELWKWLGLAVLGGLLIETYLTYRMAALQKKVDVTGAGLASAHATA